jgi:hypothetical protein
LILAIIILLLFILTINNLCLVDLAIKYLFIG